jgi:hypothetical protein
MFDCQLASAVLWRQLYLETKAAYVSRLKNKINLNYI